MYIQGRESKNDRRGRKESKLIETDTESTT